MRLSMYLSRHLSKSITKGGLAALVAIPALFSVSTLADNFKPYDKNGGHWDASGRYHCHLAGCVQAPDRFQFRTRQMSDRDRDLFYIREDWPHWELVAGCKTSRTVVLQNTSKVPVTWTNPRECEIREGLWVDEYSGEEFTRAAEMELDHIIPPVYANASNGYQWDDAKRAQFANDPFNLIPVSRETARKKRDKSIAAWEPREEFRCEYAATWRDVAKKYELDLFNRDRSRINKVLATCTDEFREAVED